jgi:aspartyl-tRNA synthetase
MFAGESTMNDLAKGAGAAGATSSKDSFVSLSFTNPTHHVAELLAVYGNNPAVAPEPASHSDKTSMRFCGYVQSVRDHGDVLFLDLRDRGEFLQIVTARDLTPGSFELAKSVRPESTVTVSGYLRRRPAETENPQEPLGYIELVGIEIIVHGPCHGLPYPIHDDAAVHESVRLKYRYLQLRKSEGLADELRFRSRFVSSLRGAFLNENFVEVETPVLFRSTPEGSRDFVVPSRLHKGNFYALVQSPQMLKQLLMIGGLERYMQLCRCFRDEDPRADRQPEFTQLDLEVAFMEPRAFREVVTHALRVALDVALPRDEITDDFHDLCVAGKGIQTMSFDTAMNRYGSDAPDLTFDLPLYDGSQALAQTGLETFRKLLERGALLKFLFVPAGSGELSRSFLETLPGMAQSLGGQGLAWLRKQSDGTWQGPIAKFLTAAELDALVQIVKNDADFPVHSEAFEAGAMLFFSCHALTKVVYATMAELRQKLASELGVKRKRWALRWVTDFPLMEWDTTEKRLSSCHHPFTLPAPSDVAEIMNTELAAMGPDHARRWKSSGYDLVLNGREIGGGSARIHDPRLQDRIFEILGMNAKQRSDNFGFLIEALKMGAPPHCGMALGIDRIVSLLRHKDSIRDIIAFPKTGQAQCLMSGAPGSLTRQQLRELGLSSGTTDLT